MQNLPPEVRTAHERGVPVRLIASFASAISNANGAWRIVDGSVQRPTIDKNFPDNMAAILNATDGLNDAVRDLGDSDAFRSVDELARWYAKPGDAENVKVMDKRFDDMRKWFESSVRRPFHSEEADVSVGVPEVGSCVLYPQRLRQNARRWGSAGDASQGYLARCTWEFSFAVRLGDNDRAVHLFNYNEITVCATWHGTQWIKRVRGTWSIAGDHLVRFAAVVYKLRELMAADLYPSGLYDTPVYRVWLTRTFMARISRTNYSKRIAKVRRDENEGQPKKRRKEKKET